jgi:DNA-binding transcriptional MerR regulator
MPYKEKPIEKLYYTIGEVSDILGVPVSTVRYWDSEFKILKPAKNKKGNRLFTGTDMKNLKIIHHLLKEEGMTIPGAVKRIEEGVDEVNYKFEIRESLQKIRSLLTELSGSI